MNLSGGAAIITQSFPKPKARAFKAAVEAADADLGCPYVFLVAA